MGHIPGYSQVDNLDFGYESVNFAAKMYLCRGASLIRNRAPLGPYRRTISRVL